MYGGTREHGNQKRGIATGRLKPNGVQLRGFSNV